MKLFVVKCKENHKSESQIINWIRLSFWTRAAFILKVFLVVYTMIGDSNAAPGDLRKAEQEHGRSRIVSSIQPRSINEISLKLLPPQLPKQHDHSHHHHHHPSSYQTSTEQPTTTTTTTTTQKPLPPYQPPATENPNHSEIVHSEFENFPDGGYRFS